MTAFWDVAPCSLMEVNRRFRYAHCLQLQIALMMEALRTYETSDNFYEPARRNISESFNLHTEKLTECLVSGFRFDIIRYYVLRKEDYNE
jgi:hypothetical protein